nr:immunoglobulin heavy chain junction region [Mus musculus]NSM03700.1 immunoglobulin heavy chain junction region [Mus musculus]NSM03754.1 immunoglobulin heavy chain junction region [Mus musculus]NSM03795.1 immunoglobulin heavy chain junction region [Mus musculus]NSM03834.1 immunoglobulin heavy chain junction region [Mus musculus]
CAREVYDGYLFAMDYW